MTDRAGLHRRAVLAAGAAGLLAGSGSIAPVRAASRLPGDPSGRLAGIEAEIGGRVGVAALDTGSGAWVRHRAGERFAMCSTFKVLLAATVLRHIDMGTLSSERMVRYSPTDLLSYAPRTAARVAEGAMSVNDLLGAIVEVSDNTAANLLLGLVGGPAGVTRWLRQLGDTVTRLDRIEPALNSNLPGDARDTSTPLAFVNSLRRILLGGALSAASTRRLTAWMVGCQTGLGRLRAAAPPGWTAGDKTGSGANGAINDVAILWPPGRSPILVAAFLSGSTRSTEELSRAHIRIGAAVLSVFARDPPLGAPSSLPL